jgi:phosphoribosylformylglycinamidine cyclo-ligase
VPELGRTVGDALLEPHRSYLWMIRPLIGRGIIKGMAHITGGGITENLPRILPHGTAAVVRTDAWEVPPIFKWLQRAGQVPWDDMMRTFNMGIGLIVAAPREQADTMIDELSARGGRGARVIGEIVPGESADVRYENGSRA